MVAEGARTPSRLTMETVLHTPDRPFSRYRELARAYTGDHTRRRVINGLTVAYGEALALAVALLIAGFVRQLVVGEFGSEVGYGWAVVPLYLAVSAMAGLLPGWGLGAVEELRRVVWVLAGVFAVTVVGLWLATDSGVGPTASRLALGAAGILSLAFVPMARWSIKSMLVKSDQWGVPAVVYGAGPAGARIVRQLQEERGIGYTPVAVFSDDWIVDRHEFSAIRKSTFDLNFV